MEFPPAVPASAVAEVTLSGHGRAEAWFLDGPDWVPSFTLLVDEEEVGRVLPMPYTYAFLGFGNEWANIACGEPGTSPLGDTVHPLTWWTAQRALDAAGVHLGVGEIPPYRISIDPAQLHLLTGTRSVRLVQNAGAGYWPASVSFLLQ